MNRAIRKLDLKLDRKISNLTTFGAEMFTIRYFWQINFTIEMKPLIFFWSLSISNVLSHRRVENRSKNVPKIFMGNVSFFILAKF